MNKMLSVCVYVLTMYAYVYILGKGGELCGGACREGRYVDKTCLNCFLILFM